jgi:hypothetical protein
MLTAVDTISRRHFCLAACAALSYSAFARAFPEGVDGYTLVAHVDQARILNSTTRYLKIAPRTITSFPAPHSPGGLHDFVSEADYFWPNPANPDGPYINCDGQSNPNNFSAHRKAMIALSVQMPCLTAAWLLTHDHECGEQAAEHLRAWFIDPVTRMTPNLEYAQGVHGVSTGSPFGIIDTLHLVEVARASSFIAPTILTTEEKGSLGTWFREYLHWMKTSEKGIAERKASNNHAVCWALQAAEFARLIGDVETRAEVRREYKEVLLPDQMANDGCFPKELARTKPYSYSIFNFDVMAMLCQSLLGEGEDLFAFSLPDGRGICKGAEFLFPYLRDKRAWPYKKDIEHFDSLPVRSPGLLFSGLACHRDEFIQVWQTLNPDPTDPEIIRNYPIRQPLLWFSAAGTHS